jgi:thymidine kinase
MKGSLELILGCTFSGKTQRLAGQLLSLSEAYRIGEGMFVFKPCIDDRYASKAVVSHSKIQIPAIPISDSDEIYSHINGHTRVVGIDEIQFFDQKILEVISALMQREINVYGCGLHTDFRGDPFILRKPGKLKVQEDGVIHFEPSGKTMDDLIKKARVETWLAAFCDYEVSEGNICGELAHYTQRLLHDAPAPYTDPLIVIGDEKEKDGRAYRARCRQHHFVPRHPRRLPLEF